MFTKGMQDALKADAEKLSGVTGEHYAVTFSDDESGLLEPIFGGPQIRIAWRNKATGKPGHTSWFQDKSNRAAFETKCRELDAEWPMISHWIETQL